MTYSSCRKSCNQSCKVRSICYCDLPLTITKSGKYVLSDDIVYCNTDPSHVGINIQTDNVDIDLCKHSILIKKGAEGTIFQIGAVKNVCIHDGMLGGLEPIDNTTATDLSGIKTLESNGLKVDNVFFKDLRQGLYFAPSLQATNNVTVTDSTFVDIFGRDPVEFPDPTADGAGILGYKLNNLIVERCNFEWSETTAGSPDFYSGISITNREDEGPLSGQANNGIIRNCNFKNHCLGVAWFPKGDTHGSLIVEDCNFLATPNPNTFFTTGVWSCCPFPDCICRADRVSGCNFQSKAAVFPIGVALPSCRGCIVEDCIFNLPFGIGVDLGNAGENSVCRNCTIRNSSFQDGLWHIFSFKCLNCVAKGNNFTDAFFTSCEYQNTDETSLPVLDNNFFGNNPIGIDIRENVSDSIIQNNTFRCNGLAINLDATSSNTLIQNNTLYVNEQHIATNGSSGNLLKGNLVGPTKPLVAALTKGREQDKNTLREKALEKLTKVANFRSQ